ncbi:MAG: prephenate dehydrogenase [Lentisphaeria bacterium]
MNELTIAIIGLGMLGASMAEKLTQKKIYKAILGYARSELTREKALLEKVVDESSDDLAGILSRADIVFFCTPIPITERLVRENINNFKENSIISDIASTKSRLIERCEEALSSRGDLVFIGGHPMAGSEKSGIEFRKFDMYKNAKVFLVPRLGHEEAFRKVEEVWHNLDATVVAIDKEKHDEVVAYASQALHIVASAAARAVLGNEDGELCGAASAGGFRDLTRIASSNPVMWREVLENNPDGNITALAKIIEELNIALDLMKRDQWDEVENFFAVGKQLKDEYLKNRNN